MRVSDYAVRPEGLTDVEVFLKACYRFVPDESHCQSRLVRTLPWEGKGLRAIQYYKSRKAYGRDGEHNGREIPPRESSCYRELQHDSLAVGYHDHGEVTHKAFIKR
jgi:hypothetical protein